MERKSEMSKAYMISNYYYLGKDVNEEIRKAEEEGYLRGLKEHRDRQAKQLPPWVPVDLWIEGNSVKIECLENSSGFKQIFTVSFPTCRSKDITVEWDFRLYGLKHLGSKSDIKGGCGNG